jgi:hypothetical protein
MVVRQFGAALVAATACALSLGGPAWACGDKLVALGGGVGFERIVVSRNPGHIVLLLEPGSGLAAANDKFNLVASLTLAGHEVFIAKSADELRTQLAKTPTDLVMVDAARSKPIELPSATNVASPAILPVEYFADGSTVPASYRTSACVAMAEGKKGATVLKAVEHTLKLRSRGQSISCETAKSSQQT